MTLHGIYPARVAIAVIVFLFLLRTAAYVYQLYQESRRVYSDPLAAFVATTRFATARWLLLAKVAFFGWALVIISVSAPVTWRTVASSVCVIAGQLLVAWALRQNSKGDDGFRERFGGRSYFCSDLTCPHRKLQGTNYWPEISLREVQE